MRSRLLITATAIASAGTLVLVLGPPAQGQSRNPGTVAVTGVQTGEVFRIAAPGPPQPGDTFVIGYDFYAPGEVAPGAEIGSGHVSCTFGITAPLCTAVHVLDGRGEIHITSVNTGPPQTGGAVVGGTGDFRNAGGEATVTFTGPPEAPGSRIEVVHDLTWGR